MDGLASGEKEVSIEVKKGRSLLAWGETLLSRDNELIYRCTEDSITADFVAEQLDQFSMQLHKPTVPPEAGLDNASIHIAEKVKKCLEGWQNRGLFVAYLPVYSPHLNITERLWKELKGRWLRPQDYLTADSLFYAVHLALFSPEAR